MCEYWHNRSFKLSFGRVCTVTQLCLLLVMRRNVNSDTMLSSTCRAEECEQWHSLSSFVQRTVNSRTSLLPVTRSSVNSDIAWHLPSRGILLLTYPCFRSVVRSIVNSDRTLSSTCNFYDDSNLCVNP